MEFANLHFLFLLLLLPVAYLFFRISRKSYNQRLKAISYNPKNSTLRVGHNIIILVFLLLIITVLQPRLGYSLKKQDQKGVDIAIVVDVSDSMLAQDVKPSRLERARREISDLLDRLKGDRLALVAFSGIAFIETPLTLDYGTFRLFLKNLSPELIPIKGTHIEAALQKGIEALGNSTNEAGTVPDRAILLITDGEDFEGNWDRIRELALENNIRIFIIGIGTPEGAPVRIKGRFKRDKRGKVVVSKLNVEGLRGLAEKTGGIYVRSISSESDTLALYDKGLKRLLKDSKIAGFEAKRWRELYQYPLALAILLLILFQIKSYGILILVLSFTFFVPKFAYADDAYRAFQNSEYEKAIKLYDKKIESSPDNPLYHSRKAASAYRLGDYRAAKKSYLLASNLTRSPIEKAKALFNAAGSMAQLEDYREAVETYEESLSLNPGDIETRENLEYVKKLLEQQQKQQKQNKNQKDKNKDKKKEDQDQDQDQDQQSQEKDQQSKDSKQQESQDQKKGKEQGDKKEEEQQQKQAKEQKNKEEQKEKEAAKKKEEKEQNNSPDSQSKRSSDKSEKEMSDVRTDQLENLLDAVKEDISQANYIRSKKALREMKEQNLTPPEADW